MQQATTIKRFRSHPLYIVSILWKYLFILLVPVIRGLYYVIINSFSLENGFQFAVNISNWAKGAWMDIVFLLAFLSLGVLLWLSFTIEVSEEGLLIKRGVLKREVRFLPVSRYNCLSVVSPMSVRLFGGVYLRVDTPGGGLKQADLLMLLRTKDCRQIIKLLQLPDSLEQPAHTRSYTPKNRYVFVLAMVTSNSFAGVLLISTFVTQAGNILGEQFSEMLYGTFENVTRTLAFGVPPAAFALACILFFGYLCAFVVSLSRHANFHVIRRKNLLEVWPGLEMFAHGGVEFAPYRTSFEELIPSEKMKYMETYNASEGFFAMADDPSRSDMLLMLDYGTFFEFRSGTQIVPLEGVECGKVYAVLITSNNGLWRYEIGDTVEFTSTNPYRIRFAGRTRQYINVFGEELIVDNAEHALLAACRKTGAVVSEYSVAPCYMSLRERGAHEWIVEFEREPDSLERFAEALDGELRAVNSDYDAKRRTTLERQRLTVVERGRFLAWMRARGKNKVPRLVNDRRVADEILAFQTEQTL